MSIVTIPEELQSILSKLTERAELRDATGNFLGTFTPQKVAEDEMYEEVIKSFDLVEGKRRLEEFFASGEQGCSAEEFFAELEELERQASRRGGRMHQQKEDSSCRS